MLRALIVEDEKNSQQLLKDMIEEYCDGVEVVAIAGSVDEAEVAIDKHDPNLIFLDIELPKANGFELLERRKSGNFDVIFTTAYDQYAVKAFKFSATDYLLKPVDIDELQNAVKRVVETHERMTEAEGVPDQAHLRSLLEYIKSTDSSDNRFSRITLPTLQGFAFAEIDEIIRCESQGNYTVFHFSDGKQKIVCSTMTKYEKLLEDYNFCKIHQSHLINLKYLKSYTKGRGGTVLMADGNELDVSVRRKAEFLKKISMDD